MTITFFLFTFCCLVVPPVGVTSGVSMVRGNGGLLQNLGLAFRLTPSSIEDSCFPVVEARYIRPASVLLLLQR